MVLDKKEYLKEYYKNNKETIKEYKKRYYLNNKEKEILRARNHYSSNRDKKLLLVKDWRIKNPERRKIYAKVHRAKRRSNLNSDISKIYKEEILKIYMNCPTGYHVDHIIPINGKNVCGLHVPWNLQYLEAKDNLQKGNKFAY